MAYKIEVVRELTKGKGVLTYDYGSVSVSTECWFELADPIPAKTYIGCAATRMATKKNSRGKQREAIYIPDGQTKRRGIFIHMGSSPAWSDGCIVIEEEEVIKIWNSIQPKEARNVTVVVKDQ
ncbi:L,D-transpeptidase family protein [Microbulbifer sp. SSSA002]|uniref:L,D-transpeptidase family protein n=1 Tax=unclassified Microbulbifer TaxID=2619833 RepID=UPI00403A6745